MSISSQKQIKKEAPGKNAEAPVSARPATTGRFAGLAKDIEKIDAVTIPGYKVRG